VQHVKCLKRDARAANQHFIFIIHHRRHVFKIVQLLDSIQTPTTPYAQDVQLIARPVSTHPAHAQVVLSR
jgi:hypothetical protein